MKIAVLGYNTINIGDDIQTCATTNLVKPDYVILRDDYDIIYDFNSKEKTIGFGQES